MEYGIASIFLPQDVDESVTILQNLIATGYDINALDESGLNILHYTYNKFRLDIAEAALRFGANPEAYDRENLTLMIRAAKDNRLEFIKLLMSYGANPEMYDEKQDSPLLWACYRGHLPIVVFLVENGADPYHKYFDNRNSIMWAASMGRYSVVKYLLRYLKDLNETDKSGNTIISLAKKTQSVEKLLLKHIRSNKIMLIHRFNASPSEPKEYQLLRNIFEYYSE